LRDFFDGIFALGLFIGLVLGAAAVVFVSAELQMLAAGNAYLLSSFGVMFGAVLSFSTALYLEGRRQRREKIDQLVSLFGKLNEIAGAFNRYKEHLEKTRVNSEKFEMHWSLAFQELGHFPRDINMTTAEKNVLLKLGKTNLYNKVYLADSTVNACKDNIEKLFESRSKLMAMSDVVGFTVVPKIGSETEFENRALVIDRSLAVYLNQITERANDYSQVLKELSIILRDLDHAKFNLNFETVK
jgi:hypothetical protein